MIEQRSRCECHDCTQQRAREWYGQLGGNQNYQWQPNQCPLPCCQPGYMGDCFCTHGRATIS